MRALLADVQSLVRLGLSSLLHDAFPDWSFLHAGSLVQAMEHMNAGNSDINLVVVDLDLPGMNASVGIRRLREARATARIAVLAGTDDWHTIQSCLAAGAHGYLLKTDASEHLVDAMRTVMSGGIYLPTRLSEPMPAASAAETVPSVIAALTARQRDVLTLLADGQSTKDIARNLNLGIGTVKVHLGLIYRTLAARNRAEAVARFRRND